MMESIYSARIRRKSWAQLWTLGEWKTLLVAFLFTEMAFMVWVLIGVLGVHIAQDLGLSPSEIGRLAAIPILVGALLRLPVGMMVDRFGPKWVGIGVLGLLSVALFAIWQQSVPGSNLIFVNAVLLGVAGVSFSIVMPLVSHNYPPEHQGVVLGLTAVGGVGTVVTALFAPRLADIVGWQTVFALFIPLVLLTMVLFLLLNKEKYQHSSKSRSWIQTIQALRYRDSAWFSFFYAVTFGGYIGLTASLILFFHAQFQISPTMAGELTAATIVGGALCRPVGGWMADRYGGIRTLQTTFVMVAGSMTILVLNESTIILAFAALFVGMSGLGAGNGAIFQLIPLRFPRQMGVVTGLVGTAGGIGGFLLVWGFGLFREWTGEHGSGFMVLAILSFIALLGLWSVKRKWRTTWGAPTQTRGRV